MISFSVAGVLKSFNFDGWDQHLANQWYTICVRMEAGKKKKYFSEILSHVSNLFIFAISETFLY